MQLSRVARAKEADATLERLIGQVKEEFLRHLPPESAADLLSLPFVSEHAPVRDAEALWKKGT